MNDNTKLPEPVMRALTAARSPFQKILAPYKDTAPVAWEKEAMFASQALARSTFLQSCDPRSIRDAVINVAAVGLSLNPLRQQAALVPRRVKINGKDVLVCQLMPMFQGLIHVATESGDVLNVWSDVVRKQDYEDGNFKMTKGTNPQIIHSPNPFATEEQRGPIIGAYCVAEIKGSKYPHVTFMSIEELDAARDTSEAWRSFQAGKTKHGVPWQSWHAEMCKKTVIKRAQKTWPKSSQRLKLAVQLDNQAAGSEDRQDTGSVIDVAAIEVISKEQADELIVIATEATVAMPKILKAYGIAKIGDLPADKYQDCKKRLRTASLFRELRLATDGDTIYADDWGLTLATLESMGAETGTKARILQARTPNEVQG